MIFYHTPALLDESIDGLNINPNGIYVDITFGGGGHSRAILSKLKQGKLISFDQDPDALANAMDDPRFTLCHGNFRFLKNYLRYMGIEKIDGLLGDLGVSSHHFDTQERGFSFVGNAPLDMRMNPNANLTAKDILNHYEESSLYKLFRENGEVENPGKLVSAIAGRRAYASFQSGDDFIDAIQSCIPRGTTHKYMAKVYQALRIEVNHELDALKEMLMQCPDVIKSGGRLVIITYHSLEDRLVKNFIRSGNFEGQVEKDFFGNQITPFKALSRKVIVPTKEELTENNRARSAKLRIAEKSIVQ